MKMNNTSKLREISMNEAIFVLDSTLYIGNYFDLTCYNEFDKDGNYEKYIFDTLDENNKIAYWGSICNIHLIDRLLNKYNLMGKLYEVNDEPIIDIRIPADSEISVADFKDNKHLIISYGKLVFLYNYEEDLKKYGKESQTYKNHFHQAFNIDINI